MGSATAQTVSDPFRDPSRFSVLPVRAVSEETDGDSPVTFPHSQLTPFFFRSDLDARLPR